LTNANFLPYDERHPERWSIHNLSRIDPSKEKLHHHTVTPKPFRRLTPTNLSEATLAGACLRDAVLVGADLSNADFTGADLRGANLRKANLRGAIITRKQLAACESFEGATMPDRPKRR
jgi:uncharacterized protein YjbI with pentapeptide repeats